MDNGLLHIDLARPQPESRVRTIAIGRPGAVVEPQRPRVVSGGGRNDQD
jgi:hypothetical protein